ncbi:unnamed protein product, partial [Urochloa humidicola]
HGPPRHLSFSFHFFFSICPSLSCSPIPLLFHPQDPPSREAVRQPRRGDLRRATACPAVSAGGAAPRPSIPGRATMCCARSMAAGPGELRQRRCGGGLRRAPRMADLRGGGPGQVLTMAERRRAPTISFRGNRPQRAPPATDPRGGGPGELPLRGSRGGPQRGEKMAGRELHEGPIAAELRAGRPVC